MTVTTRTPVYAHDDASVAWYWYDQTTEAPAIEKLATWIPVSSEAMADALLFGNYLANRGPFTWAERASRELYRYQFSYRIGVAWAGLRRRLADAIYPEREYDA